MAKEIRSAATIARAVQDILNDEGLYSPVLDMAIEDYAQVAVLKSIAFEDATGGFEIKTDDEGTEDVGGRSVVFEYSREGDRRYKINPAYSVYIDLVQQSQKILDALCMTAKSAASVGNDEFDKLGKAIEKAING